MALGGGGRDEDVGDIKPREVGQVAKGFELDGKSRNVGKIINYGWD